MTIDKILVGDDEIEFAKNNFPYIPNIDVEFVSTPEEIIRKALNNEYTLIVTDLNYTENGLEGYRVLEALKDISVRKILWTGNAQESTVKERARELGVTLLDKDEIGTIVGQVTNKAPMKTNGKILIYAPEGPLSKAINQTLNAFVPGQYTLSSDIKRELLTNEYGLVIDTSTMINGNMNGVVVHDMKYLKLTEVPRVIALLKPENALVEMLRHIIEYNKN